MARKTLNLKEAMNKTYVVKEAKGQNASIGRISVPKVLIGRRVRLHVLRNR